MPELTLTSARGSITIARDLVEDVAVAEALRCYGVVGLVPRSRVGRLLRRGGVSVSGEPEGIRLELHVVIEHGLNLAEVAATVRSRLAYEVERVTGLPVAAVEVVIDDVRVTA